MKVSCSALVELFQEIGWKQAPKKIKDDEWTLEKIRAVPKNVQEMEFESEAAKELADKIVAALEADVDVEFVLDRGDASSDAVEETPKKSKGKGKDKKAEPDANKAESKPSKKKTASKKDSTKQKKQKKESSVEKDKFGSRLDTRCAKINAVLSKKPKTLSVITEESGASSVSNHLATLMKKGYVVRTDKGYAVA